MRICSRIFSLALCLSIPSIHPWLLTWDAGFSGHETLCTQTYRGLGLVAESDECLHQYEHEDLSHSADLVDMHIGIVDSLK